MNSNWCIAVALCVSASTIAGLPSVAAADAVDDAFARGQRLAEEGKIAEAEAAFEEAWAGRKSWDIAGNLGLMEAELGKWEESAEHLDYAVTHIGGLAKPSQKKALNERFELAKSKVGRVSVNSGRVVDVKVGARIQRSDLPLYLSPGTHKLECSEEGYESTTVDVTVVGGQTQKVVIELTKKPGGTVGPVVPPLEEPRPSWPGWLLGGVGLATAGVGAGLLGVGQAGVADAEATGDAIEAEGGQCPANGGGDERCVSLAEDVETAGTLSTGGIVMLIAGGALLIGGVIYLVLPDEKAGPTVGLIPWVGHDGAGLVLQGAY